DGIHATDAGAENRRGSLRQLTVKRQAGLRDRLLRRHDRELRNPVKDRQLAVREVLPRVEAFDFAEHFLIERLRRNALHRSNTVLASLQPGPVTRRVMAERSNGPKAGDDDAMHEMSGFLGDELFDFAHDIADSLKAAD